MIMEVKMTRTIHHLMRTAAVLALAGACASASAQSGEYRRGYEEGFAAGQRAALDNRGEHGGWGRVHIEEAEYGVRGGPKCDARDAVRNEVERNDGAVRVGNQLCGDPMPHQRKQLRVVYRCRDTAPARAFATEGETLKLTCRR
jgi:hypothetical protein